MYYNPPRRLKRRPDRPLRSRRRPASRGRIVRNGKIYPIRRRRKAKSYTPHVVILLIILAIIGYFAFKNVLPALLPGPVAGCPKLDKPYVQDACRDARDAGIDPARFVRQINMESGFNPGEVSPAGAVGIAQFLPSTAAGMGINPWSPDEALKGAAQYMARLQAQYDGDYAKALAAYNAGTGAVQSAVTRCGLAWRECLPAETVNYINVIM